MLRPRRARASSRRGASPTRGTRTSSIRTTPVASNSRSALPSASADTVEADPFPPPWPDCIA